MRLGRSGNEIMNINYIKKLPGVPDDRIFIKEIVDKKILSKPYAIRIANYILDRYGRKWWVMQGKMAATDMLYQFDDVEFWLDGVRYQGFLTDHPELNFSIKLGESFLIFQIEGHFLKDE